MLGPKVYDEYAKKISYGGNKKANVSAELLFPMPARERRARPSARACLPTQQRVGRKTYDDNSSSG